MRFCKHKTNGSFGENKLLPDVRAQTYGDKVMCKYCKPGNSKIIGEWKPDRISVQIKQDEINSNKHNLIIAIGAFEYIEEINFCPMCGRKLTND